MHSWDSFAQYNLTRTSIPSYITVCSAVSFVGYETLLLLLNTFFFLSISIRLSSVLSLSLPHSHLSSNTVLERNTFTIRFFQFLISDFSESSLWISSGTRIHQRAQNPVWPIVSCLISQRAFRQPEPDNYWLWAKFLYLGLLGLFRLACKLGPQLAN